VKGNKKLIESLNALLADELGAISQYIVHAEMAENWGYGKLHAHFQKRAIDEMKHAEKLVARVLFLEGLPIVSKPTPVHIGAGIPKQFDNDWAAEAGAVAAYNGAILLAGEVKDFATRELLEAILLDEDRHIDEIETMRDQIAQMGLQVFLSTQTGE